MNLINVMLSKINWTQKLNTIWFHLHEVEEQAKAICGDRYQNSGSFLEGRRTKRDIRKLSKERVMLGVGC